MSHFLKPYSLSSHKTGRDSLLCPEPDAARTGAPSQTASLSSLFSCARSYKSSISKKLNQPLSLLALALWAGIGALSLSGLAPQKALADQSAQDSQIHGAAGLEKPFFEGADYRSDVPSFQSVLGYEPGARITSPEDMQRYMAALARFDPARVKSFRYGKSFEGRDLIYLAISSPENIAKLDAFQKGMQALANPKNLAAADADHLIKSLPASIWLAYSVHGNEISSTDAAMMTAYHLLASQGDSRVKAMLDQTVIFINPLQNPDGRARFVNRFYSSLGLEADTDRASAEHNEPWPSGRTNHYLFDLNRDWLALTQPETKGHVEALQNWYPLVFVDLHEMEGDETYYFTPEADPYNPHLVDYQRKSLFLIGKNNAKWFDKAGLDYFTRDIFDAFYPGYGASWPAYYGALAMTYEQASARGLGFRRLDGSVLTYRDSIRGHFLSGLSTIEVTARERERFLRDFYDYQKSAIDEGRAEKSKRYYVIDKARDQAGAAHMTATLQKMGIEVSDYANDFSACGAHFSKGAYIIDSAQPRKRMIRTFLEDQIDMEAGFLKEQERRRAKAYSHDIYDVTAWSMPKQFNITTVQCGTLPATALKQPVMSSLARLEGKLSGADADTSVTYIAPWGDRAHIRLMTQALRRGLKVKSHDDGFTIKGKAYPRGSLIFDVADNGPELRADLSELAQTTGVDIDALDTTWVDQGRDLGSRSVFPLYPIKIAMLWDEPTDPMSAGNSRFVIEQQMGYPVTPIRTADLNWADLSRYQVLILPHNNGAYEEYLGMESLERLKAWVERGGVLIAQGQAVSLLTSETVNFIPTKLETLPAAKKDEDETSLIKTEADYLKKLAPTDKAPDALPGALVYASVDPDHFLSTGVPDSVQVLAQGSDIYSPLKLNEGKNIIWYKGADDLLSSGYLWEENRKQLAYKPFMMASPQGHGYVIAFTQDPTYRAYMDGLLVAYANSLFRASGHAQIAH